jgi:SAM-dependent methyltransferase
MELKTQELDRMKDLARTTWAAGDYDAVAQKIWSVGADLVARGGIRPGEEVLDVACGTGNVTIPAARTGATVTGLDLTPRLLEIARVRAAGEGLEIEFVAGDAEELPFGDDSFDVVCSTFGVMFAPRQEVAAAELARVTRPGGRLALASWTPEGSIGDFFRATASHLLPRPGLPPVAWGSEERVEELLGDAFELELERTSVELRFDSVDQAVSFYEERFGPVIMARSMLEPEGKWEALHDDLMALWEGDRQADGSTLTIAEYLVALGRRR